MHFRVFAAIGTVGLLAACAPEAPQVDPSEPTPTTQVAPTTAVPATTVPATTATTTTTSTPTSGCVVLSDPTPAMNSFEISVALYGDASCYFTEIAQAAARWEAVITSNFAPVTTTLPADRCGTSLPARAASIDGIDIDITIAPIDGVGGVLGQAGPCLLQRTTGRPISGIMVLDSADVAALRTSGRLADTLTHEMGHILGLGTTDQWDDHLVEGDEEAVFFDGVNAQYGWGDHGGTGLVPVETNGGVGTAFAHWSEVGLNNELMTGYLNNGRNPMSAITIGALADLFYDVDYSRAETYTVPSAALQWNQVFSRASVPTAAHTEPIYPGTGGTAPYVD